MSGEQATEADAPQFDHVDAEGRGFNDSPNATPPRKEADQGKEQMMLPGLELDPVLMKDDGAGTDTDSGPDEG